MQKKSVESTQDQKPTSTPDQNSAGIMTRLAQSRSPEDIKKLEEREFLPVAAALMAVIHEMQNIMYNSPIHAKRWSEAASELANNPSKETIQKIGTEFEINSTDWLLNQKEKAAFAEISDALKKNSPQAMIQELDKIQRKHAATNAIYAELKNIITTMQSLIGYEGGVMQSSLNKLNRTQDLQSNKTAVMSQIRQDFKTQVVEKQHKRGAMGGSMGAEEKYYSQLVDAMSKIEVDPEAAKKELDNLRSQINTELRLFRKIKQKLTEFIETIKTTSDKKPDKILQDSLNKLSKSMNIKTIQEIGKNFEKAAKSKSDAEYSKKIDYVGIADALKTIQNNPQQTVDKLDELQKNLQARNESKPAASGPSSATLGRK